VKEVTYEIIADTGLHARPAAAIARAASAYAATLELVRDDGVSVNPKSIMGLLTLAAARGTRLTLRGDGTDVDAAFVTLATVFLAGLAREVA
jgi:phosphocarrier protein HPr